MTEHLHGKELYDRLHHMTHLLIDTLNTEQASIGMIAMVNLICDMTQQADQNKGYLMDLIDESWDRIEHMNTCPGCKKCDKDDP